MLAFVVALVVTGMPAPEVSTDASAVRAVVVIGCEFDLTYQPKRWSWEESAAHAAPTFDSLLKVRSSFSWHPELDANESVASPRSPLLSSPTRSGGTSKSARGVDRLIVAPTVVAADIFFENTCCLGSSCPWGVRVRDDFTDKLESSVDDVD